MFRVEVVLSRVVHSLHRIILCVALAVIVSLIKIWCLIKICLSPFISSNPLSACRHRPLRTMIPSDLFFCNFLLQKVPLLLPELLDGIDSLLTYLCILLLLLGWHRYAVLCIITAVLVLKDLVRLDLRLCNKLVPQPLQRVIFLIQHSYKFINAYRHDEAIKRLTGKVETNFSSDEFIHGGCEIWTPCHATLVRKNVFFSEKGTFLQ